VKHIIIGGNGFVGRQLAQDLDALGESVVVADIERSELDLYRRVPHVRIDVRERASLDAIEAGPDDIVYNMAAKMLSPIQVKAKRRDFFWPVNFHGVENLFDWMKARGVTRFVQFTTDMVYGHTKDLNTREDHAREPLGEYGKSKLATELLCEQMRGEGFNVSIFRPRLIIGPGRLGILVKMFKLIDANLPLPLIGSGANPYQFISVYDCASACVAAWKAGVPNAAYNLGSSNPPSVRDLLNGLIREAGSKSFLVPTPAPLVKLALATFDAVNLPLMDPEQYLIADETCIRSTEAAKRDLGWEPRYGDAEMLARAYREYRAMTERMGRAPTSAEHAAT
jgi:dTDP-glucose 4,6-dehydratase